MLRRLPAEIIWPGLCYDLPVAFSAVSATVGTLVSFCAVHWTSSVALSINFGNIEINHSLGNAETQTRSSWVRNANLPLCCDDSQLKQSLPQIKATKVFDFSTDSQSRSNRVSRGNSVQFMQLELKCAAVVAFIAFCRIKWIIDEKVN